MIFKECENSEIKKLKIKAKTLYIDRKSADLLNFFPKRKIGTVQFEGCFLPTDEQQSLLKGEEYPAAKAENVNIDIDCRDDEEKNIIIMDEKPQNIENAKPAAEETEPSKKLNNAGSEYPGAIEPTKDSESTEPLAAKTEVTTTKEVARSTRYSTTPEKLPRPNWFHVLNFFKKSNNVASSNLSQESPSKQTSWWGNLWEKIKQAYTNQKNLPQKPTIKTQIPAINRQSPNLKNPYRSRLPQNQKINSDQNIPSHQIEQRPIDPIQKRDPDHAPQNIEFSKPPEGYPDGTLANERLMFKILEKVREK